MKHRRVFVALICLLSSAVAVPQAAAAAACQWKVFDLAWPDKRSEVRGSSPDNRLIVGTVTWPESNGHGVIWTDGVLSWMTSIPIATSTVTPYGVNNSGVVVGHHKYYLGDGKWFNRAFRYQNGAYEYLYTAPGEDSQAIGINEAGDIIGEVWQTGYPGNPWIALWPRDNQPRRLYLKGQAIGITDDRKLVVEQDTWSGNSWKVWAIDGYTGVWTAFPGARGPVALDDDRVFTSGSVNNSPQIHEWTLDGRQVGAYDKGWAGHGRNSSGTVYGWTNNGASVWQGGIRTEVLVAGKVHEGTMYGDVTEDGRLIGTYRDAEGKLHAAIWFCS